MIAAIFGLIVMMVILAFMYLLWKLLVALSNIGGAPPRTAGTPRQPVARSDMRVSRESISSPVSTSFPSTPRDHPTIMDTVSVSSAFAQVVTADDRWIGPGQKVTVAGITIDGGMLYVGRGLRSLADHSIEPALIDPSLPVARVTPDHSGSTMGYWPSYSGISPPCRAAYLEWLATGRRNPAAYIGYVFLFFYGLERRALADISQSLQAAADHAAIQREVQELLAVYGQNASFSRYATQLLDLLTAMGNDVLSDPPMERTGYEVPLSVRVVVGRLIADGKPIPSDWALSWCLTHPKTVQRPSMRRCRHEFTELFRTRFTARFGEGMPVKANRTKLKLSIRPASSSFGGNVHIALNLPDIEALSAPVGKVRELAERCAADLDAYSRWVGRNPAAQKTVAALALLPRELGRTHEDSEAKGLWAWLETVLGPHDRAVCIADDLLQHCPSFGAGKLAKSEGVILAQLLEKRGVGIEPDVRFGGPPIAPGGRVTLFKIAPEAPSIASSQYAAATVLLHLAMAVAAADGTIGEAEEKLLRDHMQNALGLSTGESVRLAAHMEWLRQSQPGFSGLKRRLEAVDTQQRQAIADFLIGVAGADGHVSPEEIKTLGKIYPLLGLPSDDVYRHVHAMTAGATPMTGVDEPVTIVRSQASTSYAIPSPPSPTHAVSLNMAAVQAKLADSAKLAAILEDVFREEEAPSPVPPPPVTKAHPSTRLPKSHTLLLTKLAERPQWTRDEFEEAAQAFGLMADGALDTLNEAAFEHIGGPVLEGEDPIDVDLKTAQELLI